MGLKVTLEVELPLTKDEAEGLTGLSMMTMSLANVALSAFDPTSAGEACGVVHAENENLVCTYTKGHGGNHRFVDFGAPGEES
jgi:hypothetical protein